MIFLKRGVISLDNLGSGNIYTGKSGRRIAYVLGTYATTRFVAALAHHVGRHNGSLCNRRRPGIELPGCAMILN